VVAIIKLYMAKTAKKPAKKKTGTAKKNKLGVKNSLVNNINARKKKGISRSKKKSSVSKKTYHDMEKNWGKDEK
jgi:hypothetical protein